MSIRLTRIALAAGVATLGLASAAAAAPAVGLVGDKTLVWFETHETLEAALLREKQIKRWRRAWKDALIMEANPDWRDISSEIQF